MFKCYTLSDTDLSEGIDAKLYESILAYGKENIIRTAEMHLVPVLPDMPLADAGRLGVGLAFLKGAPANSKTLPGALLSIDPLTWRLCSSDCALTLLDPGGLDGHVLVFAPPGMSNLLVHHLDSGRVLVTDAKGTPDIISVCRASILLDAIGYGVRAVLPALRPEALPACQRAGQELQRSTHRAVRPKNRSKSRT